MKSLLTNNSKGDRPDAPKPRKTGSPEIHQHSRNPLDPSSLLQPSIISTNTPSLTQTRLLTPLLLFARITPLRYDSTYHPTLSRARPCSETQPNTDFSTSSPHRYFRLRYLSRTATTIARREKEKRDLPSRLQDLTIHPPALPHSSTRSKPIQPSSHTFTCFQTIRPRLPRDNLVVSSFLSAPVSPGPVDLDSASANRISNLTDRFFCNKFLQHVVSSHIRSTT